MRTEQEKFLFKCQEHFTFPFWDTKRAFTILIEDPDLQYFVIRELGGRLDYFSDEQEADLALLIERMYNHPLVSPYDRLRLDRIDLTILTLKLLLTLADEIHEQQYYKGLLEEVPIDPGSWADRRDYDQI